MLIWTTPHLSFINYISLLLSESATNIVLNGKDAPLEEVSRFVVSIL
jgi:hypothetical protein